MSRDYPSSQGGAAIGARLRRLSERIDREAEQIYKDAGVAFEQRWYGVINQLATHGAMSVGDLAQVLGVTHVAISQVRASLEAAKLVETRADFSDGRRRTLLLTASGKRLVKRLTPVWNALNAASRELDREAGGVIETLARLEAALDREGLAERATGQLGIST